MDAAVAMVVELRGALLRAREEFDRDPDSAEECWELVDRVGFAERLIQLGRADSSQALQTLLDSGNDDEWNLATDLAEWIDFFTSDDAEIEPHPVEMSLESSMTGIKAVMRGLD